MIATERDECRRRMVVVRRRDERGVVVKDLTALMPLNRCLLCGGDVHSIVPAPSHHVDVQRLRAEETSGQAPNIWTTSAVWARERRTPTLPDGQGQRQQYVVVGGGGGGGGGVLLPSRRRKRRVALCRRNLARGIGDIGFAITTVGHGGRHFDADVRFRRKANASRPY